MNLPNKLTILRIFMIPFFILFMMTELGGSAHNEIAGIIFILLLVSIFLISNTVTMGIAVRKDEINIMKYIGATDFFVRAPFVVEGILIGLIGSVIPLIIIYFVYTHVITYVVSRFTMLSSLLNFLPVETVFNSLIPISLLIGIGIGFFGSFITVRKHLHV